jgi:hypothetical protein
MRTRRAIAGGAAATGEERELRAQENDGGSEKKGIKWSKRSPVARLA